MIGPGVGVRGPNPLERNFLSESVPSAGGDS